MIRHCIKVNGLVIHNVIPVRYDSKKVEDGSYIRRILHQSLCTQITIDGNSHNRKEKLLSVIVKL